MSISHMLSVVIPAYNEEKGIADIVRRVLAVEPALREVGVSALELLVVDDGSKDHTRQIVQGIAAEQPALRLIAHPRNRGYGAALKTGFGEARGELIGFLDADGTYPPEAFPQLCTVALGAADLVIGSRMAGAASQMPATRRLGNWFFAGLLTLLTHQRVTDSASGMRVFKRAVLERLYPLPDGLNLTPVMSTRAIHEHLSIVEMPIAYSERVGRSKLSVVRDGSLFLRSMLWTALYYNPVRILGISGLAGILLGALCALALIVARLQGVSNLGAWGVAGVFAGAIAAFVGFSLLNLGITFNYLVAIFHRQPVRQGLFGRPLLQGLDRHFGWLGLLGILLGSVVGAVALALAGRGWEITRLWFYLLGGAMAILTGVHLAISWVVLRVLDELSARDALTQEALPERPAAAEPAPPARRRAPLPVNGVEQR